jgi:hypothetical protein
MWVIIAGHFTYTGGRIVPHWRGTKRIRAGMAACMHGNSCQPAATLLSRQGVCKDDEIEAPSDGVD